MLELMQSEYLYSDVADRLTPGAREELGSKTLYDQAHERVGDMLASYYPTYIDPAADKRIRDRFPIRLQPEDMKLWQQAVVITGKGFRFAADTRNFPERSLHHSGDLHMSQKIDENEDIVLSELPDDELTEQMHDDLYDGLADEIAEGTQILLDRGWAAKKVLDEALVGGMNIVGEDFRDGILFVPEVLLAANSMKAGMVILQPILAETGVPPVGKMVIGTVKGDIHDIGKNLVGMMMEGAGFEVIDLGINTDADTYIEALKSHQPNILGMSALLTTTMPYMKVVIDTLKDQGMRDDYIVMVGGAPLNDEFGKSVGADAYCRDAATAVEVAKKLVGEQRASLAEVG